MKLIPYYFNDLENKENKLSYTIKEGTTGTTTIYGNFYYVDIIIDDIIANGKEPIDISVIYTTSNRPAFGMLVYETSNTFARLISTIGGTTIKAKIISVSN